MKIRLPSVVKIALGNLWEHKSKTIILGLLIMIGVCVIILGNSFLESSNNNIKRDMIANYSGDIMKDKILNFLSINRFRFIYLLVAFCIIG